MIWFNLLKWGEGHLVKLVTSELSQRWWQLKKRKKLKEMKTAKKMVTLWKSRQHKKCPTKNGAAFARSPWNVVYILKWRATLFNLFDTKQEDTIYTHKANYSLHKNEDNFKRQQKRAQHKE